MKNKRSLLSGLLLLLIAVGLLFLPGRVNRADFELIMLDVGQGDSFVIGCDGHYALVDGGGELYSTADMGEYIVVPYLRAMGVDSLDYCINTHPDADHIGGLFAVIDQLKVDELVLAQTYGNVILQEQLLALAAVREVPVHNITAPETLTLGDAVIDIWLAPAEAGSVNSGSLVLRVNYGDEQILLCGDLEGENQQKLLTNGWNMADIDVLQIPHHGSRGSFDVAWYEAFEPKAVLVSVGLDNSYGHPYPAVTDYWQRRGAVVLRTDVDGSVRLVINDGQPAWQTFADGQ